MAMNIFSRRELRLAAQEFVLTFLWVFMSMGATISATFCLASCGRLSETMAPCPPPTMNVQVSLATGFAAGVANGLTFQPKAMAMACDKSISFGGQFNPAVTLALALKGDMPLVRAVVFILAQCLASLVAALLTLSTSGRPCLEDNFHMMKETMAPAGVRILLQVIFSLVIVLVPLWAHQRRFMAVPILICFAYIATTLTGLPQLMDVPNVLRCFGLFLIGVRNWSMVWTAGVGTIIAAPLAVLLDVVISSDQKCDMNGGTSNGDTDTDTDPDEVL